MGNGVSKYASQSMYLPFRFKENIQKDKSVNKTQPKEIENLSWQPFIIMTELSFYGFLAEMAEFLTEKQNE